MAEMLTGAVPSDSDIDFNIQFLNNLRDSIADPERAPILGDTLRAMSGKDAMPVRVHPAIAELYEMTFPEQNLFVSLPLRILWVDPLQRTKRH